jgi:[protein-PII] uridylyltransferase
MQNYLAKREALICSATPGLASARELCTLTDEAVRELARAASSPPGGRWALVALGGWGAGALLPGSDLDILVLSGASGTALKPFVESVLYPLWDAGLKVGHQVRSPREQRHAMRDDLITCTAALTGRAIGGDTAWADEVLAAAASEAHKRSRKLLAELSQRPRPGTPYALEPDLKEDAGGRRDLDELTWRAAIASGRPQPGPLALEEAGLASGSELEAALRAAETIAAARFELSRRGAGNRMTLDAADLLPPGLPDAVQLGLATTALVLARVRRRASGGIVEADTPLSAESVLALLDAGELPTLEEAAQAGRLEALVPGYRGLMTLRRPGIGHELTVGAHSLKTAALASSAADTGLLGSSELGVAHRRSLQVAALVHDVGKTEPGAGHAERGASPAADAAARFGLPDDDARDAADLVRLHLALAETATRADLDDEESILAAAGRIGRRELVAPLHVLTAADSRATGPSTWNSWTAALVGTLVSRLEAALSDEVDGAGIASRGEAVRAATLSAMATSPADERTFVQHAPLRYLATREPEQVARHASLVADLSRNAAREARIAVGVGPTPDTHEVTVVAPDRPELLARIAGAMSLAGLDILALDAYGSSGGIALDTFVVASATLRPATTETFTNLERLVRAALRDRLELQTRLAERRRHYPARGRSPLKVETVSAGWDTAVRVSAADRPGLLHDLARAITADGLDIRWAKVVTVDGTALDTFHVVGADGGPVTDPGLLGHLAMRLREVR